MADKFPEKPKMKTYDYGKAGIGGFDENFMKAKDYVDGVAKAVGKTRTAAQTEWGKLETKVDKAHLNVHENELQARARIGLAYADGLKKGQTLDQTFDALAKKYPAAKK